MVFEHQYQQMPLLASCIEDLSITRGYLFDLGVVEIMWWILFKSMTTWNIARANIGYASNSTNIIE